MDEPRVLAMLPDVINGKTQAELLEELRESSSQQNCYELEGMKFSWVMPQSAFEGIKTFEVRDDDVFIPAYPKSGNHWLHEIVQYIQSEGKDNFDRSFMNTAMEVVSMKSAAEDETAVAGYKIMETWVSPRCLGTHCHARFLPPKVWGSKAKVIYMARNPKDTFVSFFNFMKEFLLPSFRNWDAFFFSLFTGTTLGGSWFDHALGFWERRNDENVLHVTYESLHKDLRGSICKIAKHLDKDLSDDVIDYITKKTTFHGMKNTYQKLVQGTGDEAKMRTKHIGMAPFLLKGKVGRWKNYFTVAQSDAFDMIYNEKLQGTGLDFDFEL
ncbi:sulfotransferase 1B1-like [Asterias amurensis]|uniref:sulfotransferase 1B1-like n=1 Tax=Asterias amurensis TaxID=7602 RepID=UPI003AB3F409